jgi:hypothetical protein
MMRSPSISFMTSDQQIPLRQPPDGNIRQPTDRNDGREEPALIPACGTKGSA